MTLACGFVANTKACMASRLQQVHEDLWVCPVPYRAMGLPLGRQLVVIRLPAGGLWVHSPIPWNTHLHYALGALGEVRHVVGPNCFHDECLSEFQGEYPKALFHAAPGLAESRRDVRFGATLGNTPHRDWADALDQHLVAGMPRLNEVVFHHRPSRSLIIADLAMSVSGSHHRWFDVLLLKAAGAWGGFGPTRMCRMLMKDRAAVRASLEHILSWDFDRIIVGHGTNVTHAARETMRDAFRFVLEPR